MWHKRFRLITAVFACLVFISQAFAVVDYGCAGKAHMAEQSGHSMAADAESDQASMSEHQGHAMHAPATETASHDCCSQTQCSMVDCVSVQSAGAALVADQALVSFAGITSPPTDYSTSYLAADTSSLFRPPISR